jgi:hypothetical protein
MAPWEVGHHRRSNFQQRRVTAQTLEFIAIHEDLA